MFKSIDEIVGEEHDKGRFLCPVCQDVSADLDKHDGPFCYEGCDLSQYHWCPVCNEIYIGAAGYCDHCINNL